MSRKQNRAFKRGEGHRDRRLFVIVAEGQREDHYFEWFHERNQRIIIHLVPRDANKSAPTHFIERLTTYLNQEDIKETAGDSIWFVLDVDKWKREHIDDLIMASKQAPNWHIAISNPCFEVWLNLHTAPVADNGEDCNALKAMLNKRMRGGFHPNAFCPLIEVAIRHAQEADTHPTQVYPDRMQTKVYLLASAMKALLGKNWH